MALNNDASSLGSIGERRRAIGETPEAEIASLMRDLLNEITCTEDVTAQLISRLADVVSPRPPEAAENGSTKLVAGPRTGLGSKIHDVIWRLRASRAEINSALERLEL